MECTQSRRKCVHQLQLHHARRRVYPHREAYAHRTKLPVLYSPAPDGPRGTQGRKKTAYPITVGEDCWLGGGVIVCPGVTIGDRCIIAAESVVTKDIPDDSLAAGVPAVVKKSLKKE